MIKLLIAGCSWSCGEWDNVPDTNHLKVSHPGITEYLSANFAVVNISKPYGSNWNSCYAVENYLRHVISPKDKLEIIVFQTDPMRDNQAKVFDVDYRTLISDAADIHSLHQTLVEIFYIKLNQLAERHHCRIHVVGGHTDLCMETLSLYPRLVALCPSWIKLLDSHHNPSVISLIIDSRSVELCKKQNRLDLCDEFFKESESSFLHTDRLLQSDMFGPAYSDFHPSRKGHEVMADYIADFFSKRLTTNDK
jgi:hypothetical protein